MKEPTPQVRVSSRIDDGRRPGRLITEGGNTLPPELLEYDDLCVVVDADKAIRDAMKH